MATWDRELVGRIRTWKDQYDRTLRRWRRTWKKHSSHKEHKRIKPRG